jgi:hypothetical protein
MILQRTVGNKLRYLLIPGWIFKKIPGGVIYTSFSEQKYEMLM